MLQHVHDEIFRYAWGVYLIRNIDFAGNVNELWYESSSAIDLLTTWKVGRSGELSDSSFFV